MCVEAITNQPYAHVYVIEDRKTICLHPCSQDWDDMSFDQKRRWEKLNPEEKKEILRELHQKRALDSTKKNGKMRSLPA